MLPPPPIFGSRLSRTPPAARLTFAALLPAALFLIAGHAGSARPAPSPTPPRTEPTYRNPLFADVADPFVLKHRGEYYLYRTTVNGKLDVLLSRDLVHWRQGPIVWEPEGPDAENARNQWAPEVYYENGRFLLLFSANPRTSGDHRLWLAAADRPTGPFRIQPAGELTAPWRIDAHMFLDDDGARYLYTCHKVERGARIEGRRIRDLGSRLDDVWTVMVQPERDWEGIWVEAPTVLKDSQWVDGAAASGGNGATYFMLYSAPDAESARYEVGYATASHPLGPWRKREILVPNVAGVPGPGHQCVTVAPDNLTPYLLYHRKRLAERGWLRDLMLDRLAIQDGRLLSRAPTQTAQPAPPRPAFEDHFDSAASLRSWTRISGTWGVDAGERELVQREQARSARVRLTARPVQDGVMEVNFRRTGGNGGLGVSLASGPASFPVLLLTGGQPVIQVGPEAPRPLPEGFDPGVYHRLLLIRRAAKIEIRLDGRAVAEAPFTRGPAFLELITRRCSAAFSGIAVTARTQPLPLPPAEPETLLGWRRDGDRIEHRLLDAPLGLFPIPDAAAGFNQTGALTVEVQGWALGTRMPFPKYGVRIQTRDQHDWVEAYLDPKTGVLATHGSIGGQELPWRNSSLPVGFDYTARHTLSVRRQGDRWRFAVDGGSAQVRDARLRGPLEPALGAEDARAVFRLVRPERERLSVPA